MDPDLMLSDLREQVAELTAENARLKRQLDEAHGVHNTILCPTWYIEQAQRQCRGEEPGTILRETDGLRREWVLSEDNEWQPR